MFAPTKVWRKWHQKINLGQKYAESQNTDDIGMGKLTFCTGVSPPFPPLLLLPALPFSSPVATASVPSLRSLSSSPAPPSPTVP